MTNLNIYYRHLMLEWRYYNITIKYLHLVYTLVWAMYTIIHGRKYYKELFMVKIHFEINE